VALPEPHGPKTKFVASVNEMHLTID